MGAGSTTAPTRPIVSCKRCTNVGPMRCSRLLASGKRAPKRAPKRARPERSGLGPAWGEANKPKAIEFLQVLDGQLADSQFVCGDAFTVADITGLVAVDFMRPAKITLPEELANVRRWHSVVSERSSARA